MLILSTILRIMVVEAATLKVWQMNGGMGQAGWQIMNNGLKKRN